MATQSGGALPPPKQIRFVNNQGQPPSKRRRVNAACLTCRKRKTRCDGEKPTCLTCKKNGHQCLGYPDHPEKTRPEKADVLIKVEAERAHSETAIDTTNGKVVGTDFDQDMDRTDQVQARQRESFDPKRSDSFSTSSGPTPLTGRESHDLEQDSPTMPTARMSARRSATRQTVSCSEDGQNSSSRSPLPHRPATHKVPYFRYFGPTAIIPGLKQMVVNVGPYNWRRGSRASTSVASPLSLWSHRSAPSHAETVLEPLDDLPVYDPNDHRPVAPLITSLVDIFFLHLGCIHPFLRSDKIPRLVKEKKAEAILVDAMCALAARFANFENLPGAIEGSAPLDYGHIFAQRAKAATVDTFPCPTVGAVQAYLLMAYEGFGANQDSLLWMYLGLAIRMAFDMGLQKKEGVQYQGYKDPWYTGSWNRSATDLEDEGSPSADNDQLSPLEQQEIVQERIDTAWAVYILDRVISTGTGRTVTVRDDEFELPVPTPVVDSSTGLPAPYPVFAHIIQLHGRVTDVLNKVRKVSDLTEEKVSMLAKIERELTSVHEKQDPRLQFNPLHFDNYVRQGQGTLFILLHVWFHACIIILHQPLLMPFGNRHHQLTPTSRELAMSSAKTIADILAFAEVIDPNSYRSSPFTSQPMYIAACAFLTELAAQSSLSVPPNVSLGDEPAKHSLLAEKANENYQRCYKSLQQLQEYWTGVTYIINALDQRSKGTWDCEAYTAEDYASTKLPRRTSSLSVSAHPDNLMAWSLTGTTNSPSSTLTRLFQNKKASAHKSAPPAALQPQTTPVTAPTPPGNWRFDPVRQSLPENVGPLSPAFPQPVVSAVRYS
ncbi:fungal-specific transcription factor domain-domain-containing protein, partial [Coniella lustricola]